MPNEEEKFSLDEMVAAFDIQRISMGAPVFDVEKLTWLNGRWLRENLSDDAFIDRLIEWRFNRARLEQAIPLVKERVDVFSQLAPMTAYLVEGMPSITADSFSATKQDEDTLKRSLQFALWALEAHQDWSSKALQAELKQLAEAMDMKIRDLLSPLFIAISGRSVSPPLFDSMAILGPDMTRARVRHALNTLGGVSKKQAKRLDSEYRTLQRG